jgi:hypothetical protein
MQNPLIAIPFYMMASSNRVTFPINTKDKNKNYINFFIELVKENEKYNKAKFDANLSKIGHDNDMSK